MPVTAKAGHLLAYRISVQNMAVFGREGGEFVEGAGFELGNPLRIGQQGADDDDKVELIA